MSKVVPVLAFALCVFGDLTNTATGNYRQACINSGYTSDTISVRSILLPGRRLPVQQAYCCNADTEVAVESTTEWLPARQPICLGQQYNPNVLGATMNRLTNRQAQSGCFCKSPYKRTADGSCSCCQGQTKSNATFEETCNGPLNVSYTGEYCRCNSEATNNFVRIATNDSVCIPSKLCTKCDEGAIVGTVEQICAEKNCQGVPMTYQYPWGYSFCRAGLTSANAYLKQYCVCAPGYTRDAWTKRCVKSDKCTTSTCENKCGIVTPFRPATYKVPPKPPKGSLYSDVVNFGVVQAYNRRVTPVTYLGYNPVTVKAKVSEDEPLIADVKETTSKDKILPRPIRGPNGFTLKPPCSCDKLCAVAGDCCADFPKFCPERCPCTYVQQPKGYATVQSNCITYFYRNKDLAEDDENKNSTSLCVPVPVTRAPTPPPTPCSSWLSCYLQGLPYRP